MDVEEEEEEVVVGVGGKRVERSTTTPALGKPRQELPN